MLNMVFIQKSNLTSLCDVLEQVFNQTKTEFRKYDHTNMIDDIEKSLLVVKPNHLNNYFNNTIKIINSYKTI